MNQIVPLESARVAILGLGLMGGSLALALKGHCREIMGIDPQEETLELALHREIVTRVSTQPESLLPEADVIILAAPVGAILELIERLPELHTGKPMVMDIGSTKSRICQALNHLPERFDPIGGHPMCGKETSGLENAEASLFEGAAFALTPLPRTSDRARSNAEEIVKVVGAHPLWLDPEQHDRWTAATSHMPYLLSTSLALSVPENAAPLVGPGFRSTSRLAGSSTQMMLDILSSNRENILNVLENYRGHLDEIQVALETGDEQTLGELLRMGRSARKRLLQAGEKAAIL